jgi:hypothetical protein
MTSHAADRHQQVALWLIVVLLAVIATVLIVERDDRYAGPAAYAQGPAAPIGARGIFMVPAQLSPSSYGLFMIDVDAGTLWCYEYVAGKHKLRLAAARSWIFDRYLEEYNVVDVTPAEVAKLVETQRSQRMRLPELLRTEPESLQPPSR